jgi:hypothetical protein
MGFLRTTFWAFFAHFAGVALRVFKHRLISTWPKPTVQFLQLLVIRAASLAQIKQYGSLYVFVETLFEQPLGIDVMTAAHAKTVLKAFYALSVKYGNF